MNEDVEKRLREEFDGVLNARKKAYSKPEEIISSLIEHIRNAPRFESERGHISIEWNKNTEIFCFSSNLCTAECEKNPLYCKRETVEAVANFLHTTSVSMQTHENENSYSILVHID